MEIKVSITLDELKKRFKDELIHRGFQVITIQEYYSDHENFSELIATVKIKEG